MPSLTRVLRPGALQAALDERGLSHERAADQIRRATPGSRMRRSTVWEAASGRVRGVSYATAAAIVWGLDVRPSDLFVMPGPALTESQDTSPK